MSEDIFWRAMKLTVLPSIYDELAGNEMISDAMYGEVRFVRCSFEYVICVLRFLFFFFLYSCVNTCVSVYPKVRNHNADELYRCKTGSEDEEKKRKASDKEYIVSFFSCIRLSLASDKDSILNQRK